MEVLDVITLFGILGVISTIGMVLIFRIIPRKSPKKVMESELLRLQKAYSLTVDEVIARNQALNKSIQSENNRLRKELAGGDDEEEEIPLPPELLAPIAKKLNMQPAQMETLLNSPQVKKLLKGNKDILPMILPLLGGLGGNNQQGNEVYSQNQVSQY